MSHVATIELEIKDLAALKEAAKRLGLEFVEGQKSYRWFGRYMGDAALPVGFKPHELGLCEHALRVPGRADAYEVGVVKRRDGKPGYTLLWDYWQGGYGLEAKIGKNASLLKQRYQAEVFKKQAMKKGLRVTETFQDGRLKLEAR